MEFSNTIQVTVVDILPANNEDAEKTGVACCYQLLNDFGDFSVFFMSFCVLVALPVIELVIGSAYFHECPMNNFIPIYLIVAGLISSIILIFVIIGRIFVWPLKAEIKLKSIKSILLNAGILCQILFTLAVLSLLFAVAWFIIGNIWIFRSQSTVEYTNNLESPSTYCHHVVYRTGFGSIIIKYIFLWFLICRLNCYVCFHAENILHDENQV